MRGRTWVLALDFDNCVRAYSSTKPFQLAGQNNRLFEYVIQRVRKENYEKLIIVIGSARWDFYVNQFNTECNSERNSPRYRNAADCFIQMPVIAALIEQKLRQAGIKVPVEFNPTLLADIFATEENVLLHGEHHGATVESRYHEGRYPTAPIDESKRLMTAYHLFFFESTLEMPFDYELLDDRDCGVLDENQAFYEKNPDYYFSSSTLRFTKYVSGDHDDWSVELTPLCHLKAGRASSEKDLKSWFEKVKIPDERGGIFQFSSVTCKVVRRYTVFEFTANQALPAGATVNETINTFAK